jgi:tellurite resistance protein TerC
MLTEFLPWAGFLAFVLLMLALDLGVFHRDAHAVTRREALAWSCAWIGLAVVFNAGVYATMGGTAGVEWTTGYLVEKSLSIDNVFVFILIFSAFRVPAEYQHRVLFWGIIGALVMRAILIAGAGLLLGTLHWTIYIFGAFLIFTGIRFLREQDAHPDLAKHPAIRFANRVMRVTHQYHGQRFFVRHEGMLYATPLFLALLLVETTDVIFAVDSIPAIYAITGDPFIVFTSNVFAILGLRALYFVLAGYLGGLVYLKPALAAILVFVGGKMLLADVYHMPPLGSLAVIVGILGVAIVASLARGTGAVAQAPPGATATEPGEATGGD